MIGTPLDIAEGLLELFLNSLPQIVAVVIVLLVILWLFWPISDSERKTP